MKDRGKAGSMMIHPAPFRGPHSVTIKGERYPQETSGLVLGCHSKERCIVVVPGLAPFSKDDIQYRGIPASIKLQVGEKTDTIGGGSDSPVDRARSCTIGVVVNDTQANCYCGNKAIARASKKADQWGSSA